MPSWGTRWDRQDRCVEFEGLGFQAWRIVEFAFAVVDRLGIVSVDVPLCFPFPRGLRSLLDALFLETYCNPAWRQSMAVWFPRVPVSVAFPKSCRFREEEPLTRASDNARLSSCPV